MIPPRTFDSRVLRLTETLSYHDTHAFPYFDLSDYNFTFSTLFLNLLHNKLKERRENAFRRLPVTGFSPRLFYRGAETHVEAGAIIIRAAICLLGTVLRLANLRTVYALFATSRFPLSPF